MAAVVAVAILSVVVYLLTGGTLLQQKTTLYLYMPDATGIEPGTAVRVNGTSVGKVGTVEFSGSSEPTRVIRLTLSVERAHLPDIPGDSSAQIGSEGALGDRYIDISQGKARARILPGGEIQFRAQPELLKTLDVQQFAQQLRSVDATLTDIEQGRGQVGELVTGTAAYSDLRQGLEKADRGFREATSATGAVGRLLTTDQDYRQVSVPLAELDDRLGRIQAGQGQLGRLLREDGQYVSFRDQAASLRKSTADFRAQQFLTSDDLYVGWNKTVSSLIEQVDALNTSPLFSTSRDYDNLAGAAREMRDAVRDFRRNPKKYLRIQLF